MLSSYTATEKLTKLKFVNMDRSCIHKGSCISKLDLQDYETTSWNPSLVNKLHYMLIQKWCEVGYNNYDIDLYSDD